MNWLKSHSNQTHSPMIYSHRYTFSQIIFCSHLPWNVYFFKKILQSLCSKFACEKIDFSLIFIIQFRTYGNIYDSKASSLIVESSIYILSVLNYIYPITLVSIIFFASFNWSIVRKFTCNDTDFYFVITVLAGPLNCNEKLVEISICVCFSTNRKSQ